MYVALDKQIEHALEANPMGPRNVQQVQLPYVRHKTAQSSIAGELLSRYRIQFCGRNRPGTSTLSSVERLSTPRDHRSDSFQKSSFR